MKRIHWYSEKNLFISRYGREPVEYSRVSINANSQALLYVTFGLILLSVVLLSALTSPFIPVVFIAALLLLVICIAYPSLALFLVFMGAGLPTLVFPLPGHTLRTIEPLLLLCLLIVVVRRPFFRLSLPHSLMLLFVVFTVISFIHVPDIAKSTDEYGADKRLFDVVLFAVAFFCGTALVGYIKNVSSFLVAVLLSQVPIYLIGLAQIVHVSLPSILEVAGAQDSTQNDGRLWGPFPGAATFGLYLVNVFAVALACLILGNCRRDRVIGAVILAVTTLELAGSGTRSASFTCLCLFLLTSFLMKRYKLLISGLTIGGGILFLFSQQVFVKFMHPEASASNRVFLWSEAIKLIGANPWVGIGMEQFHIYYARFIISQTNHLNPHGISVHNQYLEWAMESGLPYLIVFLALIVTIFIACFMIYRRVRHEQRCILLAILLAVPGNMMVALLDVPFNKDEATVFLFLLAGLAIGQARRVTVLIPEKRQKPFALD